LKFFDIRGKLVYQKEVLPADLSQGIQWDAQGLPSGLFILKLQLNGKQYTRKILLQK
jgi:hypothetical protein